MRSYWEHLKTQENRTEAPFPHPHFRASALFPVLQKEGMTTRLIFLGYWMLKRNIPLIGNVITLRSEQGEVLLRTFQEITLPKCYRIELKDLMKEAKVPQREEFQGSIEVEFFSAKPLVFPFPAVTINYYGENFSSVVHAMERVYNDIEDVERNQKNLVKEAGFDVHFNERQEPFFALVNGPKKVEEFLEIAVINHLNEVLRVKKGLQLQPYETRFFYPALMGDLKQFLEGKTGTLKITIDIPWVFPRMLAGNLDKLSKAMVLTHTYYDSTLCNEPQDFWLQEEDNWYAASLMLPLEMSPSRENSISFYPIYSPSPFTVSLEIYSSQGKLLSKEENFFQSESNFKRINLQPFLSPMDFKERFYALRLIAKARSEKPIPSRIKVALNIGTSPHLPCNICTNLQPYYPAWENKKRAFRWVPLLFDQKGAVTLIMNSSPVKNYCDKALIRLTLYREDDEKTLQRELEIPPQGFIVLDEKDQEIEAFLERKIGWMTIESQNPYLTSYYFVYHPSGIVGGDHGY